MSLFATRIAALWQAVLAPSSTFSETRFGRPTSATASLSGVATGLSPVTTTALPDSKTPQDHWVPDRYDPFVCAYLGENDCWQPSEPSDGPPYNHDGNWPYRSRICTVEASNDPNGDDTPSILKAFDDCRRDGHIIFENTTYYVRSVMNTTGLQDVDVEIRGTLLWSTDIEYWLANSLPVGFQNQTSAWHFGGENIHLYGHGYGTLHGNGQVWYDFNQGESNRHGRPHAITILNTKNSVIEGLQFLKSQMWTMTVARSEKVLLQDIYVNNTSEAGRGDIRSNVNTDGCDTVYANNITFLRWTVDNGDDSITLKQNSTNIYIGNSTFYHGESIAIGSIGQYPGQIEIIENVTAENIIVHKSEFAARIKTWTGLNKGYPPNGGGGGFGYAKNITFKNFTLDRVGQAWAIIQCTSYNGMDGGCDTSRFQVRDMYWGDSSGTITGENIATLQCSAAAPCTDVTLFNNQLLAADSNEPVSRYLCDNVVKPQGFNCTGPCDGNCPR
ncbi:glycoside hydrolase family 28 protein [Polychaeton citri CBS 116435]|uniref:Glycoside hydrolase family 28 protein n=1 Tax=Polychaeton citri CBS 116435 TaxID=1314669 RepID=A0A9P4QA02_9PEZI|nr:glycoside hydrolase family 28 protein [Polychaeton citri CBS 116435]